MKYLFLSLVLAVSGSASALEVLSEQELSAVTGGTIEPEIAYLDALNNAIERAQSEGQLNDQESLDALLSVAGLLLFPFTEVLTADREVVGVDYGDRIAQITDQGVSLQLPVFVERISYHNIRPEAGENNPSMGSIHLEGVRFSEEAYIRIERR